MNRVGEYMYGVGDDTMESVAGRALAGAGWTVAVAESCTGGLVAKRLTDVPGSSAYFVGGVVAYSNDAKMQLLDVSEATLREHGAVSARSRGGNGPRSGSTLRREHGVVGDGHCRSGRRHRREARGSRVRRLCGE